MKYLYIVNECISSSKNGIGTYIKQLIHCLSDCNISIGILNFNSDQKTFCIEKKENICYYYFPQLINTSSNNNSLIIDKFLRLYVADSLNNFFLFNYSPSSLLMKTIQKSHPLSKQIYVIHDMGWTSYLFGDIHQYLWILKHRKEKSVVEQYSKILEIFKEEIEMCQYANYIISLSEDTYELLSNHYPIQKDKLILIPNVLSKRNIRWTEEKKIKFREKIFIDKKEKILLYVGRMIEQKGIFVYIEAFKKIVEKYPFCRLIIVGPIHNWENILKKCHPVCMRIHFTGLLSSDELEQWYQIADIGILPSYTEQCSYVGLEMIAHKLPIIASDGFGIRCMFNDTNAVIAKIGKRSSIKKFKTELINSTFEILSDKFQNKYPIKKTYNKYSETRIRSLYKKIFQSI